MKIVNLLMLGAVFLIVASIASVFDYWIYFADFPAWIEKAAGMTGLIFAVIYLFLSVKIIKRLFRLFKSK
ncbi:hypothetical protein [Halobacillus naozhouensis]|uniref:Uncharacterized protein n=1 Tax=Halobacillus naozhouensis TaxID=554880 RepID=A0ABY8J4V7_9BACI|nr:hypothetical protein [Halobacillus naozhouensis]WFT77107.1 hypothetical protein P9989_21485 [Halobacillus naozhouensis]